MDKQSTKFVALLCAVALVCVASFMWFNLTSRPPNYIELFGESGFTVVKTSSKLDLTSVIMTYSLNQFTDSMTRWRTAELREPGEGTRTNETLRWAVGSEMRDPIIYWYKESGGHIFYFINVQGRAIAFRP